MKRCTMGIYKYNSIKVSERVFDMVADQIDWINDNGNKLSGYLQTFNNCREQGFYLTISDDDFDNENRVKGFLCVWVFEHRNSDDIVVVSQEEFPQGSVFNDEAYESRKHFNYNQEHEASDYIVKLIEKRFNK